MKSETDYLHDRIAELEELLWEFLRLNDALTANPFGVSPDIVTRSNEYPDKVRTLLARLEDGDER